MPLITLTDTQMNEYISGLDLAEGSEAYRTLNGMLVLPSDTFKKAVSALSQGLITFQNVRTLPAMNQNMVDQLIAAKLGEADSDVIAWNYKSKWLQASIDLQSLKSNALGNIANTIAAKFIDRWGGIITPSYDFLKTDETKFFSYVEAYIAYMVSLSDPLITEAFNNFTLYTNTLKEKHPFLFSSSTDAIRNLMLQVTSEPIFLERQSGGRVSNTFLDWIMSASWKQVLPSNYNSFMELAYSAMAASDTSDHSGLNGCNSLYASNTWQPINSSNPSYTLDIIRMSRIYLPQAYGNRSSASANLLNEIDINNDIIAYLDFTRNTISEIHTVLTRRMSDSALNYRAISGSPIGLTLCFTLA
jgi:hypothetical protein